MEKLQAGVRYCGRIIRLGRERERERRLPRNVFEYFNTMVHLLEIKRADSISSNIPKEVVKRTGKGYTTLPSTWSFYLPILVDPIKSTDATNEIKSTEHPNFVSRYALQNRFTFPLRREREINRDYYQVSQALSRFNEFLEEHLVVSKRV